MKYYTSEHIQSIYASLKDSEKIKILSNAIDIMNQYNGRTKFLCIAMAMGYNNHEGDNKSYYKTNEE